MHDPSERADADKPKDTGPDEKDNGGEKSPLQELAESGDKKAGQCRDHIARRALACRHPANKIGSSIDVYPAKDASLTGTQLLQNRRGRPSRDQRQDFHPRSRRAQGSAFLGIEGARRVVPPLGIDVGTDDIDKIRGALPVKNNHEVHAPQRGENFGTIVLRGDRTVRPFQFSHRAIAVQAYGQSIAQCPRLLQIADMAGVEQIEAAVGKNKTPTLPVHQVTPFGQLACCHDNPLMHGTQNRIPRAIAQSCAPR